MTRISLAVAAMLLAGTALTQGSNFALAQATPGNAAPGATSNAPQPGVSSSTGVTPDTGVVDRNKDAAAASGDRNQAVATTGANAAEPARGANSFNEGEARRRLESTGFGGVGTLTKDDGGVWRGTATKDGQSVQVWLDYKGNTGPAKRGLHRAVGRRPCQPLALRTSMARRTTNPGLQRAAP